MHLISQILFVLALAGHSAGEIRVMKIAPEGLWGQKGPTLIAASNGGTGTTRNSPCRPLSATARRRLLYQCPPECGCNVGAAPIRCKPRPRNLGYEYGFVTGSDQTSILTTSVPGWVNCVCGRDFYACRATVRLREAIERQERR